MNVLQLLERLEKQGILGSEGYEIEFCPDCRNDPPRHFEGCQLKSTIDALRSGRLVVVEKTGYNTRQVIRAMRLEKERKEKEPET